MDGLLGAAALGPAGFATGAGLKLITSVVGDWVKSYLELKRQRELAIINADVERIKVLQGGEDKLGPGERWTRRILALMIAGTYCGVFTFLSTTGKDIVVRYPVDKNTSFVWEILSPFGVVSKGILEVSLLGVLAFGFITMVPFIMGFYFTKIGR